MTTTDQLDIPVTPAERRAIRKFIPRIVRHRPEVDLIPDEIIAVAIDKRIRTYPTEEGRFSGIPTTWILAVVIPPIVVFGASFVTLPAGTPAWLGPNIFMIAIISIFYLAIPILYWYARRRAVRMLRTVLNERAVPVCMKCGYSLADLEAGSLCTRCPECGMLSPPRAAYPAPADE